MLFAVCCLFCTAHALHRLFALLVARYWFCDGFYDITAAGFGVLKEGADNLRAWLNQRTSQ